MQKLKKISLFYISAISSVVILIALCIHFFIIPKSFTGDNLVITIEDNSFAKKITSQLYEENIIKSKLAFRIYLKLFNKEQTLRSGSFLVNPSMSIAK